MSIWYATCIRVADPNEADSPIIALSLKAQLEHFTFEERQVAELAPLIDAGLEIVLVPYTVNGKPRFAIVEASYGNEQWLLHSAPDGIERDNLRSLPFC